MFANLPKFVFFTGKGGMGKTTMAVAGLAARGHEVLLATPDPAAHASKTPAGALPGPVVSRTDSKEAAEHYRAQVLETKGRGLDAEAYATLEEDLRSPCADEIAVFQAFSKVVRERARHSVVMGMAPTDAYHSGIPRRLADGCQPTRTTQPLLPECPRSEPEPIARERDRLSMRRAMAARRAGGPIGVKKLHSHCTKPPEPAVA